MSDSKPTPAPEPAFFDNPAIDNLIAVTLELAAELWVQRERNRALEQLLTQRGLISDAQIDAFTPVESEAAKIKIERDAFVSRIFAAFARHTVKATPDP